MLLGKLLIVFLLYAWIMVALTYKDPNWAKEPIKLVLIGLLSLNLLLVLWKTIRDRVIQMEDESEEDDDVEDLTNAPIEDDSNLAPVARLARRMRLQRNRGL